MYASDPTTEEERKRMSGEQIGLTCLDRERDAYIRYATVMSLINIQLNLSLLEFFGTPV